MKRKYKAFQKELQEKSRRYFKEKGYKVEKRGYILEKHDDWKNNIILPAVVEYILKKKDESEKNKKHFSLHKYLHHGLSSQACIFNLLGPFIAEKDYKTLREIINLSPGIGLKGNIVEAEFEFTDTKVFDEKTGQPTSIDLYVKTDTSEKVFVEFKFTEAEFGTCSVYEEGDCDGRNPKSNLSMCYLHEKGRNYMKLMEKYGLLRDSESCPFTEFYQAYRLLLFALENDGKFLFVFDERNPTFLIEEKGILRGKYARFRDLLPDKMKEKVSMLTIQKIVDYIEKNTKSNWIGEFKRRYM